VVKGTEWWWEPAGQKRLAVAEFERVGGESMEDMVVRLQKWHPSYHWACFGRSEGTSGHRVWVVMVGRDYKGRVYNAGPRFEVDSMAEGVRLLNLSSAVRKGA
jgi:hypothetical protein